MACSKSPLTKIMATISDLRCDVPFLQELHRSGTQIVRLNTAIQNPSSSLQIIRNVRQASTEIAVLLDTKGAELRIGQLPHAVMVSENEIIDLVPLNTGADTKKSVAISLPDMNDVPVGAKILIDDGEVELIVVEKKGQTLHCRALNDGIIESLKGVSIPQTELSRPSLSSKDRDYLALAVAEGVDFIAHSFVREAGDVLAVREVITRAGGNIPIFAKIETHSSLQNLQEIIAISDGLLIARGDLGVEISFENVPLVQRQIISLCKSNGKPVLLATHLLHSMKNNPKPTRAEVSDVAHAVWDGVDVLILTSETAIGRYPIETVKTLRKIVLAAQQGDLWSNFQLPRKKVTATEVTSAILQQIKQIHDGAILDLTKNFFKELSLWTVETPIFVPTSSVQEIRKLALFRAVFPLQMDLHSPINHALEKIKSVCQDISKVLVIENDPNDHYPILKWIE